MSAPMRNSKGEYDKYAWPGGYPLYYLSGPDDEPLCAECASKDNAVTCAQINWEDTELVCLNCYGKIEAAYTDKR